MKRRLIIKETERELNSDGYATVLASNMHTFVDVFAQGRGGKFIIKAVHNIDSITRKEAEALAKLSQFMGAEPLVVGEISKKAKLKGNVSYYRFSIRCVSPDMLSGIASGEPGLLASKSVGVKVRLDNTKLRRLMHIANTSVPRLATQAKLSRSTLYKHESSADYASMRTLMKLERILHGSLVSQERGQQNSLPELRPAEFERTGMRSLRLNSGPFDIVVKDKNYYEISLDANARTLIKRAALFNSIRETFDNNYPFFLSRKPRRRIRGVPVVGKKEMLGVESEDELLELVY